MPVDIKGTATDLSLNFPDGFKTHGSGDIAIKGQRFPYTMTIHYDVTGGDITSEFQADAGGTTVKASPYLPKFAQTESFEPFRYDIDLVLKKTINVSNSLLRTPVQGKVQMKGTPSSLLMNGTFSALPGGKVMFRDKAFDITTGYVEY